MNNNYQLKDYILYRGKVRQIEAVTSISLLIYDDRYGEGTDHVLWVKYDEVEPIPITKKWIELNGFRAENWNDDSDDYCDYWISYDGRLHISNISNMVGRDYYLHIDNSRYEGIGGMDVQYAHQIQHLCRDCEYDFNPKFE